MHIGKISTAFLSLTSSRRKQRRTHSNFNLLESTQVKELTPLEAQTMICIPNKNSEIKKQKTIGSISSSSYVPHIDVATGKVSIRSTIPQGICIEEGPLGKKLVATQDFRAGDLVYTGYASLLDLSHAGDTYTVSLFEHDGTFVSKEVLSTVHSVLDYHESSTQDLDGTTTKPKLRQIYGFDAFMNHSCSANMIFPLENTETVDTLGMLQYQGIAIRDIHVGDELTCDYATFDYECDGHAIELCQCGAENCRGKMMGFRELSLEEKVEIMPYCEPEILQTFFQQNPDVIMLESTLPDGIAILQNKHHAGKSEGVLIATRDFEVGEVLFTNEVALMSPEDISTKSFVLKCDGKYYLIDNDHHFIHRDEYSEFVGFDSFMDHSCCPNTCQEYDGLLRYTMRAMSKITVGERITMDYEDLKSSKRVSFHCNCGASVCRGIIES